MFFFSAFPNSVSRWLRTVLHCKRVRFASSTLFGLASQHRAPQALRTDPRGTHTKECDGIEANEASGSKGQVRQHQLLVAVGAPQCTASWKRTYHRGGLALGSLPIMVAVWFLEGHVLVTWFSGMCTHHRGRHVLRF